MFIFLIYLSNKITKSIKYLIPLTLFIYFIIQISFILLFPLKQHSDAFWVYTFAKQFSNGNFDSLDIGGALNIYPNNIGITLLFSLLFNFFPKSYLTIRILNTIFSTITMYFIYKIYSTLASKKSYGLILITLIYLPPIIMNNHTYGDVISTSFCTISIYFSIKFYKTTQLKYMIFTLIFLIIGNFIRQTTILFTISIFIYWIIGSHNKISLKKVLIGIIISIILFNLPLNIFNYIITKNNIIDVNINQNKFPIFGWINMGIPTNEQIGYWDDDATNLELFKTKFNFNTKLSNSYFIKNSINKIKHSGYSNIIKGYTKKTFWIWNEGTYQINYFGFDQDFSGKYYIYKTPLTFLARPGPYGFRSILSWFLHSLNWLFLFLISLFLLHSIIYKNYKFQLFIYIIFFFVAFYFIWEIKSRYLYPIYPILIIISYYMLENIIYKKIFILLKSFKNLYLKNIKINYLLSFLFFYFIILVSYTTYRYNVEKNNIDNIFSEIDAIIYENNEFNLKGSLPLIINDKELKIIIDTSNNNSNISKYELEEKNIFVGNNKLTIKTRLKEQNISYEKININFSLNNSQIKIYIKYFKYLIIITSIFIITFDISFIVIFLIFLLKTMKSIKLHSFNHYISYYILFILAIIVFKIISNPFPNIINIYFTLLSDL
jgi:hypothetical protein